MHSPRTTDNKIEAFKLVSRSRMFRRTVSRIDTKGNKGMEERNDRKAKVNSKRTVNFVHIYGTLRVSRTMFGERKRAKALIEVNAKKEIRTTEFCRRIDRNEVRTRTQEEDISQSADSWHRSVIN